MWAVLSVLLNQSTDEAHNGDGTHPEGAATHDELVAMSASHRTLQLHLDASFNLVYKFREEGFQRPVSELAARGSGHAKA